jgi:hypothetical protein
MRRLRLVLDPTAGERARKLRLYPETPQALVDPTDVRCGTPGWEADEHGKVPRRVEDPTDPACEEFPA